MIYRVKNCRICADDSLNTKNGFLFSVENGVSAIINEPPENAPITDIDGKGRLLIPAFTDIGCHFYDERYRSRDSMLTASAAASAGGYRRLVTLGENGDDRVLISASTPEAMGENGICYGYYGGDVFEELVKVKSKNGLYISAGIAPSKNGGFALGSASKMMGSAGFSRYDECGELAKLLFASYESGCRVHILGIGCKESLNMIKDAKKAGANVTVGVSPFHLAFTENDVAFYGTMCKLLPPLRSRDDREALREGLFDGSIDVISSLHTPLTSAEKSPPEALYGLCSLETVLPALITYLPELLASPRRIAEITALSPSRIIGENYSLKEGAPADFILVDPLSELVISRNTLKSKSSNTPFLGQTLIGCNLKLYLNGQAFF